MNAEERVEIVLRQIAEDLGLETVGNVDDLLDRIIRTDPEVTSLNEEAFVDILRHLNTNDALDQPSTSTATEAMTAARRKAHLYSPYYDISRFIKIMRCEILIVTREIQLMREEFELIRMNMDLMNKRQRRATPNVNVAMISELLDEFSGTSCNFERWQRRVKMICGVYDLDGDSAKILIQSRLRGDAGAWFLSLPNLTRMNVNEVLEETRSRYGRRRDEPEVGGKRGERDLWLAVENFLDYYINKLLERSTVDSSLR